MSLGTLTGIEVWRKLTKYRTKQNPLQTRDLISWMDFNDFEVRLYRRVSSVEPVEIYIYI